MNRLDFFANLAKDAKTPKDLLEALKSLGPLPRYHEFGGPVPRKVIHVANGIAVNPRWSEIMEAVRQRKVEIIETPGGHQHYFRKETEPAVKEASDVYKHATARAIRLIEADKSLPPLPATEADPFMGVLRLMEWCIGHRPADWAATGGGTTASVTAAAEKAKDGAAVATAIVLSLVLIIIFELAVYVLPWVWLRDHANSYGIQAGVDVAVLAFMLGLFRPRWRKVSWLVVALVVIGALITILGGPHSANTTVLPPPSTSTTAAPGP